MDEAEVQLHFPTLTYTLHLLFVNSATTFPSLLFILSSCSRSPRLSPADAMPPSTTTTLTSPYKRSKTGTAVNIETKQSNGTADSLCSVRPCFLTWTVDDVANVAKNHWIPCFFGLGLLFFMGVEYTLNMVPSTSQPFDLGFIATRPLHRLLASSPELNTLLAGLNTVFVGMQTMYILWTWLIEGRPRATISALFMFTCRGILGYSTQLPLPEEFLGSGADFPVGNVSFFLFFSGHVAGSVIAALDMRRMGRWELARIFDLLNVLQAVRLLGTRGHYTIDLAVGVGAGMLFDSLAGKYEDSKREVGVVSLSQPKDALFG